MVPSVRATAQPGGGGRVSERQRVNRVVPSVRATAQPGGGRVSYLIRNVSVVGGPPTDVLIRDGVIEAVGAALVSPAATVIDGTGLVALPGLVDLHTHLREPGREDAETVLTGSQAAALGGFTAVCAMANTSPVADTAGVVEQVYRLGREAGLVDVQPIGAVTVGLAGEELAELGTDRKSVV